MKKFMFFAVMVMFSIVANAQRIAEQRYENGMAVAYLETGQRVLMSELPAARYRNGETIQESIARTQYEDAVAYNSRFRVNNSYGYGAGMYGMYPVYGGESSSFSIGNEHWGFSTGSSSYGGYKTSGTGIRIGSFHIGTSKSGYTQPTASQKKAAAKAAAQRYSQMKAAGVTASSSNGNTNSTAANTTMRTNGGASVLLY